jgi:hypothetical protein
VTIAVEVIRRRDRNARASSNVVERHIADLAIHEQPGCGVEQPAPAFFAAALRVRRAPARSA